MFVFQAFFVHRYKTIKMSRSHNNLLYIWPDRLYYNCYCNNLIFGIKTTHTCTFETGPRANFYHISVIMVYQQEKEHMMKKVRDKEHIRDFCCGHVIADVQTQKFKVSKLMTIIFN